MWKKLMKELNLTDSYISMGLGLLVVLIVGVLLFNYFSTKSNPEITESGEQTQELSQNTELPTTHTVSPGETLWSISEKYYQSGYNWVDIAKANNLANVETIEAGQELIIPQVQKADEISMSMETGTDDQSLVVEMPATTAENRTYTVVKGDTLWKIAQSTYNDGYKWVEIARANNLANPDIIHSGNVLILP